MAEPKYPLGRVREAAAGAQIEFDIARARSEVALVIEGLAAGYEFGASLLLELQPSDFCESVQLAPPHAGTYDVYGIEISTELADRFGVPRSWYVKFKLIESELTGETVFFVSLHLLNRPMPRTGGVLKPG